MIKMKLVSRGGYVSINAYRLPVVVMAEERRKTLSDGSEVLIYMVDGDFIPEINPGAGVFAGDSFPFYPGEVIPL